MISEAVGSSPMDEFNPEIAESHLFAWSRLLICWFEEYDLISPFFYVQDSRFIRIWNFDRFQYTVNEFKMLQIKRLNWQDFRLNAIHIGCLRSNIWYEAYLMVFDMN